MKKYIKILFIIGVMLIVASAFTISNAVTITQADIEKIINKHSNIDPNNITTEDVVTIYEDLADEYSNEELADALEQYSGELQKQGISKETVDAGETLLRTTDTKVLKEILENTDVEKLENQLENILNPNSIENGEATKMSVEAFGLLIQLLLANKIIKTTLIISIVIAIYMIIVRWTIYKKAGKHGWAAIIPIYREVVWLKTAKISPWVLLLVLLPVFGWIALAIIFLISKFTLPKAFGRSAGWGLGIWLLPIIFESVVAFSRGFKYKN